MRRSLRSLAVAATATAAIFALGACSGSTGSSAESDSSSDATQSSASGALDTVKPGKLTFATSEPSYSPWVENDDPASGEGFEAAVAYAVAEELGYSKDDVEWVRATFDSSVAPGAKDWDLNLQQFSITEERKNAVDFSSPYYTTSQALVTVKGSKAADAKSIADLKDVLIGVQSGTTSQQFVSKNLTDLAHDPLIFNSSDDTVLAMQTGKVDAIVVDVPTAFYMTGSGQIDNGTIVGQFEDSTDGDNYGIVLPKGSKLTAAVTKAVDALRDNGTLAELQNKWLSETVDVPVLK
ncbi:amino acid ABC transporter substrate-binding protein [Schaalia sp. ZJ405]|uniref:ABC transporter substrate-binding protein n=1 Tax=Schaalia sp. ZJ405 TaxID=2709403 RepID=UPI0013EBB8B7|nr:ABC transporter substrate-binding protein [Schaalia sp. ZJ405]QPK81421.1 amino acid ABC transporter substrate-binding protein [Schaalia sp. ZJ405]